MLRLLEPNPRLWGWLKPRSPFPGGPEQQQQHGTAWLARQLGAVVIWKELPALWKVRSLKIPLRVT